MKSLEETLRDGINAWAKERSSMRLETYLAHWLMERGIAPEAERIAAQRQDSLAGAFNTLYGL